MQELQQQGKRLDEKAMKEVTDRSNQENEILI